MRLWRPLAVTLAIILFASVPAVAVDGGVVAVQLDDDGDARTRQVTFTTSRAVRQGRAAPDGDLAWWTSPEVATDDARVVGVEGVGPNAQVQVRARGGDGWGPWTPLVHIPDEGPDPDSAEGARASDALFSEPVNVGRAVALQLRARGALPAELVLHAIELEDGPEGGAAPGGHAAPAGAVTRSGVGVEAEAGVAQPPIATRASWGADESIRRYVPVYAADVRFAVVHHSAGGNDYTRQDVPGIIRGIQRYHVLNRGWDDIAYNFVVDRFGGVWEGRSGGITRAVVGGHAAGWNSGSTGVVVLGNHDQVAPTPAALQALEDLLAWKLDLHHVDPAGTVTEVAGGGRSNRHPEGSLQTFPSIVGHRTNNATSCPGGHLHPHVVGGTTDAGPVGSMADRIAARDDGPKVFGGLDPHRTQSVAGVAPRVEVSFSEPVTWTFEVRADTASAEVLRRAVGSGTAATLTWDLRDDEGALVPPGRYLLEVRAHDGRRAARPLVTTVDVRPVSERVAGRDRVATSIALSSWAFASAERVVLASSETYADALAATPLAGSFSAPVLLVPSSGLTPALVAEIQRLGSERAYLVGGASRLPDVVVDQLVDDVGIARDRVTRLAGRWDVERRDRFATADHVARLVVDREDPDELWIALGQHADDRRAFPDALSAGAYGARARVPVVLTRTEELPEVAHRLVISRSWRRVVLVGGTSAISPEVERQLRDLLGADADIVRLSGADRYATSVAVRDELGRTLAARLEQEPADPNVQPVGDGIVLASGRGWPDALGAAAAAAEQGMGFLLTPPDGLARGTTRDALDRGRAALARLLVAGGRAAVADQVLVDGAAIVLAEGPHTTSRPLVGG